MSVILAADAAIGLISFGALVTLADGRRRNRRRVSPGSLGSSRAARIAFADSHTLPQQTLAHDLARALERGEFRLFYQPQVSIADDAILGYEALLRWQHPALGMIAPGEFLPIAEQHGLLTAIDDWVLRKACAEAVYWPSHLRVAVNFSPSQLRLTQSAERIRQALTASGLEPERLEIELAETRLLQNGKTARKSCAQIKALGVRITLDHFGAGEASIAALRQFAFDTIKLDRSLLDKIATANEARAMLDAAIALGETTGFAIVATGVETAQQYAILRRAGCTRVQGYYTGRPAATIVLSETSLQVA